MTELDIANLKVSLLVQDIQLPFEFLTRDIKLFYPQELDIVLQVNGMKDFSLRFQE